MISTTSSMWRYLERNKKHTYLIVKGQLVEQIGQAWILTQPMYPTSLAKLYKPTNDSTPRAPMALQTLLPADSSWRIWREGSRDQWPWMQTPVLTVFRTMTKLQMDTCIHRLGRGELPRAVRLTGHVVTGLKALALITWEVVLQWSLIKQLDSTLLGQLRLLEGVCEL